MILFIVHHKQKKHEGETRPEFKQELRFLRAGGAESNQVVRSGTSEDACRVTISVAVSARWCCCRGEFRARR